MQQFSLPKEVETAIFCLEASGFEAYLVGGCVRDMKMGKAPLDYDMASSARPEEVRRVFREYRVVETGIAHGTVTVLLDGLPIEITTFRTEGAYSDGRRPDAVCFCGDLHADLARRDFTMNAMAYHPLRGLVDPYGGQADLRAGLIRCVGEAQQRFQEDALRILRALRFAATLDFYLNRETEKSLRLEAAGLHRVSSERIRAELSRLLCGEAAPRILMEYMDVLGLVLPELKNLMERKPEYLALTARAISHTPQEVVLRWSVLLQGMVERETPLFGLSAEDGSNPFILCGLKQVDALLRRLRFDGKSRERIVRSIEAQKTISLQDENTWLAGMSRYGTEVFFQMLQLDKGIQLAKSEDAAATFVQYDEIERRARELLGKEPCLSLKDLAVKGEDLLALGFQGREVGKWLNWMLQTVLNEGEKNDKEILLSLLKAKLG